MFQRLRGFLNNQNTSKVVERARRSVKAAKKRAGKASQNTKDSVRSIFGNNRDLNLAGSEKSFPILEKSVVAKALEAYATKNTKKGNSFIRSERSKQTQKNPSETVSLSVETDEAQEDLSLLDWAREISSRNFKVATPEQLNDSMSNSEKIRLADEILMNFHLEEAEKENPFRRDSEERLQNDPSEDAWYEQEADRIESYYSEEEEWAKQQQRQEDLLSKSISRLDSLDFDEYDFD